MAPDINAIAAGDKFDYSEPGSSGYHIKPDITWNDPNNRKLRVITVGAGLSGIMMAYQIQKLCGNVDHVIYEKNSDIGGTWLENRYPNCGCDVPSHAYTYSFALDPDWPRYFAYAPDILNYLHKVCDTFDLRKYMTFHTEIVGAYWDDATGEWIVKVRESQPGQQPREFEDRCHLLLYGAGLLNRYKFPDVPGLRDKFKGRVMHTAHWPDDYQKEQWADDRIAVIGSGASSIQVVPGLQPHAKHLDVFVRTGIWFVDMAGNTGQTKEYGEREKETFRRDPGELVKHAKSVEDQINGLWGAFYSDSEMRTVVEGMFGQRTAEMIKDKRLLDGLTPKFGIGCRRVTPGDPFIYAIQEPNVDVHFTHLQSCTEDGVIGGDGVERKVDTIVCATGFDVSYRPHFPVVGKNGVDLRDKWKVCPESYLGLTVPDIPNFVMFIGPSWPVENGSVIGPLQTVGEYAVQLIHKLQNENIKSLTPKQDITDMFNEHVQEWVKHTVWKDDCRAWYKDPDSGRVNAIWPGSSMHYQQVIEHPRYEDYEIERFDKNPWACLGMGWTVQNRKTPAGADCSPYISLNNLDPKWYAAVGGDESVLKKQADELNAAKPHQGWVLGSSQIQHIKP